MVLPPAPDPDAPPTPWRVRWTDEPDADERCRSFADAWGLSQNIDPAENGWRFARRDPVIEAFNAGAGQMRVAWCADGREVWIHFEGP
jgi:hypothetical protein